MAPIASEQGERLLVTKVNAGSRAYEQGLNTGDQIVALDNMRANKDFLQARLAEKKPGETVPLSIFRFDDLRVLDIKLGKRKSAQYRIIQVAQPNDLQKTI